ncbi:hypothetical protein CXF32_01315, partial [Corynebacterium bovis]
MSSANFGQNEWLVDQMYQQYKEDPSSVDPEWRTLFEKDEPQTATSAAGGTSGAGTDDATGSTTTAATGGTTPRRGSEGHGIETRGMNAAAAADSTRP